MVANNQTIKQLVRNPMLQVFLVILDIRPAYNVGAMFRTADGTGQTGIIITGYSPTPDNPKVAKTALGSDYQVPWAHEPLLEVIRATPNVLHVGLELSARSEDIFMWQLPPLQKIFLYVGNEVTGLPLELMANLDTLLQIPMCGVKQSLNVAEATSVALYELYRKKHVSILR